MIGQVSALPQGPQPCHEHEHGGHLADNVAMEGFLSMLKREQVKHRIYRTRAEAQADVFKGIERFHNPRCRRLLIQL